MGQRELRCRLIVSGADMIHLTANSATDDPVDRQTPTPSGVGPAQVRVWWDDHSMTVQRFTTTVAEDGRGGVFVEVPFDPDALWGPKSRHHVAGTVNGIRVRGVVESQGEVRGFRLGPAWLRDSTALVGADVVVEIGPEGPQRDDLASDVASALDARPDAAEFFDSLAQFYRRAYLRWIDATKRSPELRAQRIATMVDLLSAGVKDYRQHQP